MEGEKKLYRDISVIGAAGVIMYCLEGLVAKNIAEIRRIVPPEVIQRDGEVIDFVARQAACNPCEGNCSDCKGADNCLWVGIMERMRGGGNLELEDKKDAWILIVLTYLAVAKACEVAPISGKVRVTGEEIVRAILHGIVSGLEGDDDDDECHVGAFLRGGFLGRGNDTIH